MNRDSKTPTKWLEYIHRLDAFDADGCLICKLIEQACTRHLDNLFYESVTDVGTRQRLYASQGFCNWHAHLATRITNTNSGIAIIYADLLRSVIARAERHRPPPQLLPATAGCPVCETARFNEHVFLGELLRWFDDVELQAKYRPAFGLCVPHLQGALDEFPDHPQLPALLAAEREKLVALQAELQEFTRKLDYRYAAEPKGREQTAWRRVIEKFAGKRELANLRAPDARQMIGGLCDVWGLHPPDRPRFEHEVWRLSRGNPRLIVELCTQVGKGRYVFGGHVSTQLLDLDRRIAKLPRR